MSSMIGEQLRAALPATVTSGRVTTTAAKISGVAAQSSAMIGSPMAAASHTMGNIDTQVAPQVAIVSQEPQPTAEEAAEVVSDIESDVPLAEQREEVPASFTGALEAVYRYLPENICPIPPLPLPRITSLYEADAPPPGFARDEQTALFAYGVRASREFGGGSEEGQGQEGKGHSCLFQTSKCGA